MKEWNRKYKEIITKALNWPIEINKRTGEEIKVNPGALFFQLNLSSRELPIPFNRQYKPHIAASEHAWMLMGTRKISWLQKHTKIWNKFSEDGKLTSAYGYRWRESFGRDQLAMAIEALKKDNSDRQVVLNSWHPGEDGLGEKNHKNVPCPTQIVINIVNKRLHVTVLMRSSDLAVGLPYDVMTYALFLDAMATECRVENGYLSFCLAHAHLYTKHERNLGFKHWAPLGKKDDIPCWLPGWNVSTILANPDGYMEKVKEASKIWRYSIHPWNPTMEVFE